MKNGDKKYKIIMCGVIALLFIAPLIVFATVYHSGSRKNSFAPGTVDIQVHEEKGEGFPNEGEDLSEMFEWKPSGGNFIADKDVKIKDTRKNAKEVLRVMLVPMWYDADNNVCAVFNFGSLPAQPERSSDSFKYKDGEKEITLNMRSGWDTQGWSYSSADGCFYYTGALDSSKLTAQLLDSVEMNADAYSLTDNYVFRLDVLTDAVQSSGNAAASRHWKAP